MQNKKVKKVTVTATAVYPVYVILKNVLASDLKTDEGLAKIREKLLKQSDYILESSGSSPVIHESNYGKLVD